MCTTRVHVTTSKLPFCHQMSDHTLPLPHRPSASGIGSFDMSSGLDDANMFLTVNEKYMLKKATDYTMDIHIVTLERSLVMKRLSEGVHSLQQVILSKGHRACFPCWSACLHISKCVFVGVVTIIETIVGSFRTFIKELSNSKFWRCENRGGWTWKHNIASCFSTCRNRIFGMSHNV